MFRAATLALALGALVAGAAAPAHAELQKWDAAKVTALAGQLRTATQDLYDTFYKQLPPTAGSGQNREFYRLKQVTRMLKTESRELSEHLAKGAGRDETLPIYESLMEMVRTARELGARIFATEDLKQKASTARGLLNQLGPYYDPDFQTLQPVTR